MGYLEFFQSRAQRQPKSAMEKKLVMKLDIFLLVRTPSDPLTALTYNSATAALHTSSTTLTEPLSPMRE